jgi:hypothetical protein
MNCDDKELLKHFVALSGLSYFAFAKVGFEPTTNGVKGM